MVFCSHWTGIFYEGFSVGPCLWIFSPTFEVRKIDVDFEAPLHDDDDTKTTLESRWRFAPEASDWTRRRLCGPY